MKVLILSPYPENIINTINKNDQFLVFNEPINLEFVKKNNIEFVISYGYKFLVKNEVINYLELNIINLHISYLPFNKGYYPNLWSHLEDTPSGVSIHRINSGIDRGDILIREKVVFDFENTTLNSSYNLLREKIEVLFKKNWDKIKKNKIKGYQPLEKGSFHLKKEGDRIISQLHDGWDTKICDLKKLKY